MTHEDVSAGAMALVAGDEEPSATPAEAHEGSRSAAAAVSLEDARGFLADMRWRAIGRVGPEYADEVLVDALHTVWARRDAFDPSRGSLRTWTSGVLENVIRRYERPREGHRPGRQHLPLGEIGELTLELAVEDMSEVVMARSEAVDLLALVAEFARPADYELVVTMAVGEQSAEELAASRGVTRRVVSDATRRVEEIAATVRAAQIARTVNGRARTLDVVVECLPGSVRGRELAPLLAWEPGLTHPELAERTGLSLSVVKRCIPHVLDLLHTASEVMHRLDPPS